MAIFENQIKQYQSMKQNSLKYLHLQTRQKNGIEGKAGSVTEKDGKKIWHVSSQERENQVPQRLAEICLYHRQVTCGREDW